MPAVDELAVGSPTPDVDECWLAQGLFRANGQCRTGWISTPPLRSNFVLWDSPFDETIVFREESVSTEQQAAIPVCSQIRARFLLKTDYKRTANGRSEQALMQASSSIF